MGSDFKDDNESSTKIDPILIDKLCELYRNADSVIINTDNMTRVTSELKDEEDNDISMAEIVENVCEYAHDEMADNDSTLCTQIQPFLASSITRFILDTFPKETAVFILTNSLAKDIVMASIMHGFLMSKVLNSNNYHIESTIEDVTDDELDLMRKTGEVQDLAAHAVMSGDLEDILSKAVKDKEKDGFGAYDFDDDDDGEESE